MDEESIIIEHYKQHKRKVNKLYYKERKNDLLRKQVLKRICMMKGKIKQKTLLKYEITEEEIEKIQNVVYNAVKTGEIKMVQSFYNTDDPEQLQHALHYINAYYGAMKNRLKQSNNGLIINYN